MGLLDKVKAQAEQAVAKAQQGVAQSQAKIDEMQAKKQLQGLLRDLGAAYYAQQREAGSAEAVQSALGAVDAHIATHGSDGLSGTDSPAGGGVPPQASAPPPGVQPGDFQID